jgi:hypothetical protein
MNGALAGLVILVIGDSHMAGRDYLVSSLHDSLESQGASVQTYGMCGASADAWMQRTTVTCGTAERHDRNPPIITKDKQEYTWTINDLLQKHHPNLVIVEAADAMAGYDSPQMPRAWIYEQVHMLTTRIRAANAACVWVGPIWGSPNSGYNKTDARVKEMSDFLSQSVSPCLYVDSTQFARPGQWPTTDGQHLTPSGYRTWGADITGAVVRLKEQNALR